MPNATFEGPLGRLPATDNRHLQLYGLTSVTMPTVPTPCVLGTNWFEAMDKPWQDKQGNWWLVDPAKEKNLGRRRGGHAWTAKPPDVKDLIEWWRFFNQGQEGACVGFAVSRMMTLLNRKRYDGFSLYHKAQQIDEFPGENYQGTSVRAGCDVAREHGMWRVANGKVRPNPTIADGISENRWAFTMPEFVACLSPADQGAAIMKAGKFPALNSWGEGYPHVFWVTLELADELLFRQEGEVTVVVDRP